MRWFSTFKACLLCDNRVFGMHCAKLFLHWRLLAKHLSFRCSGHSTVTHYEEIGKIVCLWLDFLCTRIMGEINYCYLLNIWLFGLTAWNWAWCQKKNVNIISSQNSTFIFTIQFIMSLTEQKFIIYYRMNSRYIAILGSHTSANPITTVETKQGINAQK